MLTARHGDGSHAIPVLEIGSAGPHGSPPLVPAGARTRAMRALLAPEYALQQPARAQFTNPSRRRSVIRPLPVSCPEVMDRGHSSLGVPHTNEIKLVPSAHTATAVILLLQPVSPPVIPVAAPVPPWCPAPPAGARPRGYVPAEHTDRLRSERTGRSARDRPPGWRCAATALRRSQVPRLGGIPPLIRFNVTASV